jgi:hypothetical protein
MQSSYQEYQAAIKKAQDEAIADFIVQLKSRMRNETYPVMHAAIPAFRDRVSKMFEGDHFKHIADKMIAEELPAIYETALREAIAAAARKKADRIAYRATKAIPE